MTAQAQKKHILVAYFSCTGTTERTAQAIAKATAADIYEIEPAKPYTAADLNWRDKQSRSSVEMADKTSRPALANHNANVEKYDVVFVGYPIWWDLCPTAVNTFIESYNFDGKIVIPFATSGGSSIHNSAKVLRETYKSIDWREGRLLNSPSFAAKWAADVVKGL